LAKTLRAATVDQEGNVKQGLTYEKRNEEAQLQAIKLRKSGINSRVVNGSGWTAVYIGLQTSGTKVQTTPRFEGRLNSNVLDRPKALGGRSWGPKIEKLEWGTELGITPKTKAPSSTPPNRFGAVIMDRLFQTKTPNSLGMGQLAEPEMIMVKGKNQINVSDAKVVKQIELVDIMNSFTVDQSKRAIGTWLNSLKASDEGISMKNREDVKKLALVMSGREKPTLESLEGVELFVAYTGSEENSKPTFFQLSNQITAEKVLERINNDSKVPQSGKKTDWGKAWGNFQTRNG
tara:strand:+ start:1896 stop:2765 length:870 start_codon:yes stop_codon:yes gene_type:complete